MVAIKESKTFITQERINLLSHSITEAEKQLNNARRVIEMLSKDLIILRGMVKDERKR